MLKISGEERKSLKGEGVILNRDGETFIARVITEDGTLTSRQLENLAQAGRQFGNGQVAFTNRMTVEIQGLTYDAIRPFQAYIAQEGLYTGGTGPRVRPIVTCKGTVCVHGLIDTQELARELHHTFYQGWHDVKLPHKFKIGIAGCPNACTKPDLNDLGIMGQLAPQYHPDLCRGCGKCGCETVCPMNAIVWDASGKAEVNTTLCNNCGKCIKGCYFQTVTQYEAGYRLFVGGYWAKRKRPATPVDGIYTSREALFRAVEKCLLLFREQGKAGERFGMFIDRIGVDNFMAQLKSDDVLSRKEAILAP